MLLFNPIRPGLFSRPPGPGGGGGSEAQTLKSQPIEMKFGMSHYGHRNISDANLSLVALLVLEI